MNILIFFFQGLPSEPRTGMVASFPVHLFYHCIELLITAFQSFRCKGLPVASGKYCLLNLPDLTVCSVGMRFIVLGLRKKERKLSCRHAAGIQYLMKGIGQQKGGNELQRMHTQFLRLVLKKLLDICSLKHSASHLRRWQLQMNRDIFSKKNQLLHKKNFLAASRY